METVKLGLLIKKTKVARCGEHSYPVLSITKQNGIIMQSEKFKKRIASADTSDYKIIPRGKLVQGIHIDEGNFGIQDIVDNGIVSPAYGVWDVNDGLVIPKYLEMVLRSPKSIEFYRSKLTGTVNRRGHMSDTDFLSMDIPLPDRDTQSEILKTMKQTTSILSFRQQQLTKLDELIKARFIEMFGSPVSNPMSWEKRSLKEVCVKLTDGTHFSPESFKTGEYKYVTAKNIKVSGFDFSNISYVPEEVHRPIYERCNPEYEDVLYIKDGATTGTAMINNLKEEFTLLSSVALLKQDRNTMNGYFWTALLNNEDMYLDIRNNMGGAAITRLTIAKMNAIRVIVPPIALQEKFADFSKQVNKSKSAVQKSLDETQVLFDSLMQKYFG